MLWIVAHTPLMAGIDAAYVPVNGGASRQQNGGSHANNNLTNQDDCNDQYLA
jgi:hypothetical protein